MADKKNLVTGLIVVGIIILAAVIIYFRSYSAPSPTVSVDVAKYIGNHSVVYVQAGCSHCKDEEDLFGDNWKYINSVDCLSNQTSTQLCISANITGTPTWVINGKQYIGFQSIDTLKNLTGY